MRASNGGILRLTGSVINNTGGSIESLAGSTVELTGGTSITAGTLSGAGTFNVLASTNVFLTDLSHSGTMTVGNNSDLGLIGAINNSGSITFDGSGSASDLEVQAVGATLTGGGTITLDGTSARITGLSGAVLTLTDQTVEGFGQVGVNALEISNGSGNLIDANSDGNTLTIDANSSGGNECRNHACLERWNLAAHRLRHQQHRRLDRIAGWLNCGVNGWNFDHGWHPFRCRNVQCTS